jgi:hypothetical protein
VKPGFAPPGLNRCGADGVRGPVEHPRGVFIFSTVWQAQLGNTLLHSDICLDPQLTLINSPPMGTT